MSVPAREQEPLTLDEVKEQLVSKGRERGFVTSEDLLCTESSQVLHERVPDLIAQLAVVNDDPLANAGNDGAGEML